MEADLPGDELEDPSLVDWNPTALQRFWDWERHFPEHYFANKYGSSIIQLLRRYLMRGDRVLDYGCGLGFLSTLLVSKLKVIVWATDSHEYSVSATNERNQSYDLFGGAVTLRQLPQLDISFDCVIAIEVLEHLDEVQTTEFFRRAGKSLVPGGLLLVTTPNREKLDRKQILCPNCNHIFHRWQHVRSVDPRLLFQLGEQFGFTLRESIETDFSRRGLAGYLSRRHGWTGSRHAIRRPHLVGVYVRR